MKQRSIAKNSRQEQTTGAHGRRLIHGVALFLLIVMHTACHASPQPAAHTQTGTTAGNKGTDTTSGSAASATYYNGRFGYSINYPPALLTEEAESQNGDGTDFSNSKGEFILTVWGRLDLDENGDKLSLGRQYDTDIAETQSAGDSISYRKLGKSFYVLSGNRKDGKIFYQKTITKPDAFAFAVLEYKPDEKPVYDSLARWVLHTFR